MKMLKLVCLHCFLVWSLSLLPASAGELGAVYGREFKHNTDVEQYEIFYRQPLPFSWEYDSGFKILSDVELGGALVRETSSDNGDVGRFSAMPQLILRPHPRVDLFLGLGAGFMVGDTEFTHQDLGGPFLLNAKVGLQFLLGQHWHIGYFYYHQSNAGIYDHNMGLNMHDVMLSYSF